MLAPSFAQGLFQVCGDPLQGADLQEHSEG